MTFTTILKVIYNQKKHSTPPGFSIYNTNNSILATKTKMDVEKPDGVSKPHTMDIKNLIPQRSPIIMVDKLVRVEGEEAVCMLTVRQDNFFIDNDNLMAESGLIEHIAQSASAFAGYKAVAAGATKPPVGYIGEVKNFHLFQRPGIGDTITTTITMGPEVGGITIIRGESKVGNQAVADTTMKIFIKE